MDSPITKYVGVCEFATVTVKVKVSILGQYQEIGFECRRIQFNPGIAAWFSAIT
jgi:hypothetical protein